MFDGASLNYCSERLGQRDNFFVIQFTCEDHITFNIVDVVGRTLDEEVPEQIHWALSLQHPLHRKHVQQIVQEICEDWVHVRRGASTSCCRTPPSSIVADMFGEKEPAVPNGDVWNHHCIDVWAAVGV